MVNSLTSARIHFSALSKDLTSNVAAYVTEIQNFDFYSKDLKRTDEKTTGAIEKCKKTIKEANETSGTVIEADDFAELLKQITDPIVNFINEYKSTFPKVEDTMSKKYSGIIGKIYKDLLLSDALEIGATNTAQMLAALNKYTSENAESLEDWMINPSETDTINKVLEDLKKQWKSLFSQS